jgi:iron donor protein CyaY
MATQGDFDNDREFRLAVGGLLQALLDEIDEIDSDDLDPRVTAGNLHVTFELSGAVLVLSQQTPTHELWLSANLTAWHFLCVEGTWLERDTGQPLLAVLGELFSGSLGQKVSFGS